MNCTESRKWIQAYVDDELELSRSIEVEAHLADCAGCKATYETLMALRKRLREPGMAFALPTSLADRIAETVAASGESATRARRPHAYTNLRWFATGAAACAAVSFALWVSPVNRRAAPQSMAFEQEAVDSHLRSLENGHLEDVVSTNQHTVKPWFNGKIGFSPPVNNLADKGFPLDGGRLDYLGSQPAAVLVYKASKHVINVYVTLADNPTEGTVTAMSSRGYHMRSWQDRDMSFVAVSDVNDEALDRFVGLFRERAK